MADTIQRDVLTIYLEPNKPIRGTVARMDTLKLVITVRDADMNLVDLSDCRLVLTATDSEKTAFWDVYTVDAENGVIAAEVQPDVVGRNEYRLKVVMSDTSEVTFFAGALAVAVENADNGPVGTIDSMTRRMLDAIARAETVQGPQGEKGEKGDKGDKGNKGEKGDKGDPGEVSQADFDALAAEVETLGDIDLSGVEIATTSPLTGGGSLADGLTLGVKEASATAFGVTRYASTSEAADGTSATRAITPARMKEQLDPIRAEIGAYADLLGNKVGSDLFLLKLGLKADKTALDDLADEVAAFDISSEKTQTLSGRAFTLNPVNGSVISLTITGNATVAIPSATGVRRPALTLTLIITNGGAYTISWSATNLTWHDGLAPTLTEYGKDIVTLFTYDFGATWFGAHWGSFAS